MPRYIRLSGVCFCNFTFMLSAGKDRNAVVTDANNAEIFGSNCDFYLNKGRIS